MFYMEAVMKIIHTADWHLGKILNGKQLLEDQAYILDMFVEKMKEEEPDIIVIAGDLYDTTYPSKDAIMLLEQAIGKLNLELRIPIIMISGNHDGKERLNYGASWFEHNQLFIRTDFTSINSPIEINGVNFYTLPYATVSEMKHYFEDDTIETHQQGITRCIETIAPEIDEDAVNILISHLSIEDDKIKYSGSLLQYSFSEAGQAKGYRRLTINDGIINDVFIPLKPLRQLEIISGEYNDVINEKVHVKNKDNYLHFKLKNMSHITDPMMSLKQIYPNTLALTNETFNYNEENNAIEISEKDDMSIIEMFYKHITDKELSDIQSKKIKNILENELRKED